MNLKGWVSLNQLPTEMQKPLSSLRAAKSISPVIELNNGFYILKVSEIKDAEVQPFEKVKDKVTENYKRQKAQELFAKVRDKLAELTYNKHPESLKPVVDELALPIETTGLFTIDKPDAPNDITANRKIREAAFSEDVLTTKNNSDIIQVDSNTAVVLRIKDHQPASTKPLNSVKADIDEALKISHSKAAAKSAVNNILAELKSNKISLDDAAKSVNLSNISVGYIGRYSSKVDPAILEKAFSIPRSNQKGIFTYSVAETPNGLAIIRLNSVRAGNVGSNTQQKESFAEQVQNSYGSMEYKLYQDNLSESAKITYP